MSVTLYVHIGWPKTGTSSIQGFLEENRRVLFERHRLLHPNLRQDDPLHPKGCRNHAFLFHNKEELAQSALKLTEAIRFAEKAGADCLISAEAPRNWEFHELIRQAKEQTGATVKIIAYLRRQDQWVESAWKQWWHRDPAYLDFAACIERVLTEPPLEILDYADLLNRWKSIATEGNMLIRRYEREHLKDQDILTDFLDHFGLSPNMEGFHRPGPEDGVENRGFSKEVIALMNLCKPLYENMTDRRIQNLLARALPERYSTEPYHGKGLLSPGEQRAIYDFFFQSNQSIAREYFGEEELFAPPQEREDWQPHQLTWQESVPMIMGVLLQLHEDLTEQERTIQVLKREQAKLANPSKVAQG